jgi:mannose-6-phosphate isomerase-like protein (cupin superfamily)
VISHWDDVRTWRGERGHIAGTWSSLTGRSSRSVGLKRIQVDPGRWSTPLHLEGAEEEIFYVLGGSGMSVQWEGEGDPVGYEVRAGDCLVHLALENAHTLRAGPPTGSTCSHSGSARSRTGSPGSLARAWRGSERPGLRSVARTTTHAQGMTLLMYGTRDPGDLCFYPPGRGRSSSVGSGSSRASASSSTYGERRTDSG